MPTEPLWRQSATTVVDLLQRGDISPVELIDIAAARIEEVDGSVNALPIRCLDQARDQARTRTAQGGFGAPLYGLPIAVKDYNDVAGVRKTYGSPIFADHVPDRSDATVETLTGNGALPIAKSNVPEWAGGHTVNPVNGLTRNPWRTDLSAGGSSGGSAAALATGQVWLATGNDLGGSLRTPAAFNGVVGLRPTPGLVPRGTRLMPFDTLWVEGPMARSVADLGLMLQAGAGQHGDDPLSVPRSGDFRSAARQPLRPGRIGFSTDLGAVPMARTIASAATKAAETIAANGTDVTPDIPDFAGAFDAFQTLRGVLLATMMGPLLDTHRPQISPAIIGNIELGFAVTPAELFAAERTRQHLVNQMTAFFRTHDCLICPATSVLPFAAEKPYVTEIDGVACETYIDWFAVTFLLTLTGCPVVALPCGITADGLPVALQIVGPPRGEEKLLSIARWLEDLFAVSDQVPIDPRAP